MAQRRAELPRAVLASDRVFRHSQTCEKGADGGLRQGLSTGRRMPPRNPNSRRNVPRHNRVEQLAQAGYFRCTSLAAPLAVERKSADTLSLCDTVRRRRNVAPRRSFSQSGTAPRRHSAVAREAHTVFTNCEGTPREKRYNSGNKVTIVVGVQGRSFTAGKKKRLVRCYMLQ